MTWYQFDFALNFPVPFNFHGDMFDMPLYRSICERPLSDKMDLILNLQLHSCKRPFSAFAQQEDEASAFTP
jgi:hypothetical protein